jgi:DNA (cytosine-5)-methyltransferase 1
MKYGSVCSGIEAATAAWQPLGWDAAFFSEIEAFPIKVLQHHYPEVPLHGDFTTIKENEYDPIDLLVGGTPCQSFSVAGLRKGLDDPRGNLMLEFGALAKRLSPRWLVWENVPGVLSSNGGRDFAAFLGMLAECGYGFAYRILDAQYFGVPQRRRRVFVVAYLGDWRRAAAVLFEQHSLQGHSKPSGKARENATAKNAGGTCSGKPVFGTLMANCGTKQWLGNQEALSGDYHVFALAGNTIGRKPENGGNGDGFDDSGVSYTLTKTDVHAVAFSVKDDGRGAGEISPTICNQHTGIGIAQSLKVRRLTPRECERLQGFKDDFTNIPGASDSARYKALGNSMAVPVMAWIGKRIKMVDDLRIGDE